MPGLLCGIRLRSAVGLLAAVFCLALGADAVQFVPAGSIAGQWTFDQVSGTTTPDSSANGNTATLVNAPPSVAGLNRNGLQFNGTTNNRYLTVPNSASLDVASGSFSIAAWVNTTGASTSRVVNKWDGVAKGWLFDVHAGAGGGTVAGSIRIKMSDGVTPIVDHVANGSVAAGSWTHIAAVIDRTLHTAKLFANGNQVGTTLDISGMTGNLTTTAPLGMASIPLALGNYYSGILDEVVLYKRVLTGPELTSLATLPPPAPTNLTRTNGINSVKLDWQASTGAASYQVLRSGTSGGPYVDPYVPVATGLTALTYTDPTPSYPNTYYYVVIAVAGATPSAYSNEVVGVPLPPEVTALPNTGLQTSETPTSTTFTIKFNQNAPAGGSVVTVDSSNTTEGVVSTTYTGVAGTFVSTTTGFRVTVPGNTAPSFQVTVTGVDDFIIDGNRPYIVSVTASGFTSLTIPNVSLTNMNTNTAGITFSKTSGLLTTEAGGTDSFSVSLTSKPHSPISMSIASSNTAEATVSTTQIIFDQFNWNTQQSVTVTGVDDSVLDFSVPYTVITGVLSPIDPVADSAYANNAVPTADIGGINLDNEPIPEPTHAWGGGGCGLTGLEGILLLALARRRSKAKNQTV
ncbi:MAG TPA: LamG-like jellyroll fold domain-containing protein [Planctomycetota bacterium]|jgi:hypothetical protein|nr:LamG-like jellyroll fold domain-containing protein [Planctomycetota bacterium]